jgi:hypothetical protein
MGVVDGVFDDGGPLESDQGRDLLDDLPRAACSPKTAPATAMAMTISGEREKMT